MNNTSTFDSVYQVKLAQIAALEGDTTKKYDSVYQTELEILKKLEEGIGGGARIDDQNISTGTVWSSHKTYNEAFDLATKVLPLGIGETYTQENASLYNLILTNYGESAVNHIFIKSELSRNYQKCFYINGCLSYIDEYEGNLYVDVLDSLQVGQTISVNTRYQFNNVDVINTSLATKQATLVSGTNIKTINNNSILGSGNIDIQGGGGAGVVELTQAEYDALAVKDPSIIYNITDASVYVMEDYFSKAAADASFGELDTKYNPKNTTTAYTTGGYSGYFPSWNSNGQIIGKGSYINSRSFTINGTTNTILGSSNISLPTVYAATTAGTAGQVLQSTGSGAPQWVDFKSDATAYISEADCSAGTYSTAISNFYSDCIANQHIGPMQLVNDVSQYIRTIGGETSNVTANSKFATAVGTNVYLRYNNSDIMIDADGTIVDEDATGAIEAVTSFTIPGYFIYKANYTCSVTANLAYTINESEQVSHSYYYPSSTRLYAGNVELWFFTTEDGATWRNFHVLITNTAVTVDVTTGSFGA